MEKEEKLNFECIIFKVFPSHLFIYHSPSSLSSIYLSISVFISNSVTFLLGYVDLEVINQIDMLIRARVDHLFQAESPTKRNQVNKCCLFTAKFGELLIISC